jgi:3-oxoacyl-[acyl-carrier-protein] synthase II
MDRLGIFAVIASRLALQDGGLAITDSNRERTGVIFGTGIGPMESMESFSRPLFESGPGAANPAVFPNTVYNAASGQVAMHVGAVGPASTVTTGHAAGAGAICYAYDQAWLDQADAVLALAADTLTDTVVRAYAAIGLLNRDEEFALAEGAVALLLERAGAARARGARIYGEILGYGIASDGKGVGRFDPRGRGQERAMRLALEHAGVETRDVRTIWANRLGHRAADASEAAAIERLFGGRAPQVIAPKQFFGEPIGVGAALSAALALKGWEQASGQGAGVALVNSSSLGGTHLSFLLAPYQQR